MKASRETTSGKLEDQQTPRYNSADQTSSGDENQTRNIEIPDHESSEVHDQEPEQIVEKAYDLGLMVKRLAGLEWRVGHLE